MHYKLKLGPPASFVPAIESDKEKVPLAPPCFAVAKVAHGPRRLEAWSLPQQRMTPSGKWPCCATVTGALEQSPWGARDMRLVAHKVAPGCGDKSGVSQPAGRHPAVFIAIFPGSCSTLLLSFWRIPTSIHINNTNEVMTLLGF